MATLNFPDAPDTGDIYFDSNSGFTYEWNGTVWISRGPSTVPTIKELDNISGSFNGSTTTFNLTASSIAVSPATAQQLLINIGNVMQNPGDDYTVSGSTITFTTAPSAGYAFQGTLLGSQIALGTVVDGTISPSSLDTSDSYTVGGITVTGITTVNDYKISGISTITKLVPSDLKVTGIGTVSNVIMTKDAAGLGATMGAAVGVVTYYGDGSNLTGFGLTMFPVSYDPGISSTSQAVDVNITLDWNRPIKAGSGTITIRTGSASGTVVDQFVVGSSSSITFANNQVILNPAADLSYNTQYWVVYPAGTVKEAGDQLENSQVNYSFTTKQAQYQLWRWGLNEYGELGVNAQNIEQSSPVQLPGTTWRSLATTMVKNLHSTATKTDGTLWAWGNNGHGQLGQNSIIYRSSPVQVGTETTWSKSHAQVYKSSMAVKTDGTLWSWGYNTVGRLGHNDIVNRSSPVQIPGTTWSTTAGTLAGGISSNAAAIKTDGTLWTWGGDEFGNLGQNSSSPSDTGISSPVQVPGTTWSKVTSSGYCVYTTRTDGTLWAWGSQSKGCLGQNEGPGTNRSSPVQIPGTTWSKLSSSGDSAAAIKTDGTLWAWGSNTNGELGQNDGVHHSSPVQIPGTTWAASTGTTTTFMATKTDGTLWTWGTNGNGALGQNAGAPAKKSSPTQIGTDTTWGTEIYHIGPNWDGFGAMKQIE